MNIIAKYKHGSQDSLDSDVFYVVDSINKSKAKTFCDNLSTKYNENANIIVIEDANVIDCYKGTCDEIQNSLLSTYYLHNQTHELLLKEKVSRDILLKTVRVIRCLLSHCSRTEYRKDVKLALQSDDFYFRLEVLKKIDFSKIYNFIKNDNIEVYKVFAFQLTQILGLYNNIEIYTKKDAIKYFPLLKKYLYREYSDNNILIQYIKLFISSIENNYQNININEFIDVKNEQRIR